MDTAQTSKTEQERGFRLFKQFFLFFVVLALIGLAFFSGYERGRGSLSLGDDAALSPADAIMLNKNPRSEEVDFALFWKVWDILKDKFVDKSKLDAKQMLYGAIDGMLASTGDPYTTFFDPKENQEFQEDISGNFEGIGAEMDIKDDILTIVAPLEDTPAERAGLLAGDKILKIDGEPTTNLDIDEAVHRIRGKKGTSVTLNIYHVGDEEAQDIVVPRDVIHVKSIRFEMKDDNRVAYIRLNRFGEDTAVEFERAVRSALEAKASGLVLDLRNNPGGLLGSAVDIASFMLPDRMVVVVEENDKGVKRELKTTGGDVLSGVPTAILINEGSASASEILAGALREQRDNVRLFGKKSFGKGSVQELVSVTRDASVKITVAKWLTPKGNQIHKVGIAPDEEVSLTRDNVAEKRDPQLDKAIEWLGSVR
ncbi:MAG: S41 family peptidase [Candidatus Moranbacteria bacterium]|nr:S41 family peptidase [Candidatus Moranbacteria bacterium]MBP6034231.1 S41 family peptidase [Candidatus Moranbacteria bacterium]